MKFNISASSLNQYMESELLFYYNYVLKASADSWVPQCYSAAGNLAHEVLEEVENKNETELEEMFWNLWYGKTYNKRVTSKGMFNTFLKPEQYLDAIKWGKKIFDVRYKQIMMEEYIVFPVTNENNIKGYIDCVCEDKKTGEVILMDWKTSSKVDSGDSFKRQGLMYCMLYWKKHNILPKKIVFEYIKIKKNKEYSFTLDEVKEFWNYCVKLIDEINNKGVDISKYEIGDITSIFNAHAKKCLKEEERRKKKLRYGFAIWGNTSKLVGDLSPLLKEGISKKLSYIKDIPDFVKQQQNWDGTINLFKKGSGSFPTGLIPEVHKVIKQYSEYMKMKYVLEYKDMREFTGQVDMPDKLIDINLRDYQNEAVESFMKSKYGIVKIRTGMGKTILASEIIRRTERTTLWIIDRLILAEQTKEVLEEALGVEVGLITEGNIDLKDITICTYQTLTKRFEELKTWLNKEVGFVIVDECHKAKSKSIKDICEYCKNSVYRLGLSATPDLVKEWLEVKGLLGDICYEMKNDDERNKQFLTDSELTFIKLDDREFADNGEYHESYESYITNNNIRNNKIKELVDKHNGKNILIITKSLDHAEILSKLLDCPKLVGETTREERNKISETYKNGDGFVCVASVQIVSEGWDVPNLSILVQASAISGAIKTIQGLGRILRKADDKTKALYYDFVDQHQRFFSGASFNRRKHLSSEGHKITIK